MHSFQITETEKVKLLTLSRNTLISHFGIAFNNNLNFELLNKLSFSGAFVSLYNDKNLRGCIGRFNLSKSISETIEDLTLQAALSDTRFPPVEKEEVTDLIIEISILSPLKRFFSIDEFELGKHGVYIKSGYDSGTFLPQVAEKTNWTKEEFLGHCSRDKAGIGWEGWKHAELYCYEALVFSEKLLFSKQ